jgi:Spy/CpxP family protein refolding chaperone
MQQQQIANEKELPNILDARQLARLKQIALQRSGAEALRYTEVAKALNLTDEQKEQIKHIHIKMREDIRSLRGEKTSKKIEEMRKGTGEKMMNVLTAEQKTMLKEMMGEPFKGQFK